jgi:hypothetical protein
LLKACFLILLSKTKNVASPVIHSTGEATRSAHRLVSRYKCCTTVFTPAQKVRSESEAFHAATPGGDSLWRSTKGVLRSRMPVGFQLFKSMPDSLTLILARSRLPNRLQAFTYVNIMLKFTRLYIMVTNFYAISLLFLITGHFFWSRQLKSHVRTFLAKNGALW